MMKTVPDRTTRPGFPFLLLLLLIAPAPSASAVKPGLDVVVEREGGILKGRRIGLITNHTGRSIDGTPAVEVLSEKLGLDLRAIFSPEHGFTGKVAAGDPVASSKDTAIPVHSLYGDLRKPTPEMLADLDVLVFDIQDLGVRFYTYISTMKLAMEAAAEAGIDFVVLDRPNPNGGLRVEGPLLDPVFESFVGIASIPLLHGMTVGELARMFRDSMEGDYSLHLEVIPVQGYRRDMSWEETGLVWRSTSPNIRTLASAIAYPAIGLFEGANLSEGRGVEETFLKAGAPWIEAERLSDRLREAELPGVSIRPVSFTPRAIPAAPRPRYRDELCFGFELDVHQPEVFEAVRTGLTALQVIRELYPEKFRWRETDGGFWIDQLLGTQAPREALERGVSVEEILRAEREKLDGFLKRRRAYLIYD